MTFEDATTEYISRIDRDGGSEFAELVGDTQERILREGEPDLDEAFRLAVIEACAE